MNQSEPAVEEAAKPKRRPRGTFLSYGEQRRGTPQLTEVDAHFVDVRASLSSDEIDLAIGDTVLVIRIGGSWWAPRLEVHVR